MLVFFCVRMAVPNSLSNLPVQPALLYLVPACLGASLLTAAARGELPLLLAYSEEKETKETTGEKKD